MSKLDEAKKMISEQTFKSNEKGCVQINLVKLNNALQLASQTKWHYIDCNEIPSDSLKVLCIDYKNEYHVGFHKEFDKPNAFISTDDSRYFHCIAWSYLPSFL